MRATEMKEKNTFDSSHWHDDQHHYAAVGQLVTIYTQVELTIKSILFNLLNMPEIEFNILLEFGRIKSSDTPTIIRNLVASRELANEVRKQNLIDALKNFEKLSQSRNQLVHWLWIGGGTEPTLLNLKVKARQASSTMRKGVTLAEIRGLSNELLGINAVLCSYLSGAACPQTLMYQD